MGVNLESIVRPFSDRDVTPTPYTKPGQGSVPQIRLQIGYVGQVKTLGFSMSATTTFKMGQAHNEKPPTNSESLQSKLAQAAGS